METVAVFGFMDSLAGQVVNFLDGEYNIAFFISVDEPPELDVEEQHSLRPNAKTEFVVAGKIFGKEVVVSDRYVDLLVERGITKCFVLEDDRYLRQEIIAALKENGIEVLSYVHPTAVLCGHNTIGEGVVVFPQCYVGYKADVLDGTIMQSNCTIEHHSVVGRFCNVNPNLTTGGFVKIDDLCEINMSVDIVNRITIGARSRIGAGALVMANVPERELWYGRPARYIRGN